jgi:hypothetical protein
MESDFLPSSTRPPRSEYNDSLKKGYLGVAYNARYKMRSRACDLDAADCVCFGLGVDVLSLAPRAKEGDFAVRVLRALGDRRGTHLDFPAGFGECEEAFLDYFLLAYIEDDIADEVGREKDPPFRVVLGDLTELYFMALHLNVNPVLHWIAPLQLLDANVPGPAYRLTENIEVALHGSAHRLPVAITPLIHAVLSQDANAVVALVRFGGAFVNLQNPVFWAACAREAYLEENSDGCHHVPRAEVLTVLLALGGDPELIEPAQSGVGIGGRAISASTALVESVMQGDHRFVEQLLAAGASPHSPIPGYERPWYEVMNGRNPLSEQTCRMLGVLGFVADGNGH